MAKLDDVPVDALREALDDCTSAKAATRVMVALAYKDGVSVSTLHNRYGIPLSTLYSWLDRFEERSLTESIADKPRPGRPRRLSDAELAELERVLAQQPAAVGRDEDEWTPNALREHVKSTYGVSYSTMHARRLLDDLQTSK